MNTTQLIFAGAGVLVLAGLLVFFAIPTGIDDSWSDEETSSLSGIKGTVMLGPTCPVMREPPDPQCADKPFKTNLVLTTPDGARVLKTFSSDEEGTFSVQAEPGEYAIRSAAAANILPYCQSVGSVKVESNRYAVVEVSCDSGIR